MNSEKTTNVAPVHGIVIRRFALLGGEAYYASGGFHDFIASFDTLGDAVQRGKDGEASREYNKMLDWWQVWDCESNAVVAVSESQAYGASDSMPRCDG